MTEKSKESCDCKVFETFDEAEKHGKGAIFYSWIDETNRTFPEGVKYLRIFMPLTSGEAYENCVDYLKDDVVDVVWHTDNFVSEHRLHQWKLSGTYEKPTLSPSLNWIGYWHGFLRDGRLESC